MAFPASLPALGLREAITDALYRCVLSFDTADLTLFESAFTADATLDLNGNVMSGIPAIRAGCYDTVSKLDTTHFLTNVRVNAKQSDPDPDPSEAFVTASALAYHYRTGEGNVPNAPSLLSGSLYFVDVVRDADSGLWKVKNWKMKLVWTEGDWGVMTGN